MLNGFIRGRQNLRDNARAEVASKWGLPQKIGGPVISAPYCEEVVVSVSDVEKISYRLFLILAAIMYLTRTVDWYNINQDDAPTS